MVWHYLETREGPGPVRPSFRRLVGLILDHCIALKNGMLAMALPTGELVMALMDGDLVTTQLDTSCASKVFCMLWVDTAHIVGSTGDVADVTVMGNRWVVLKTAAAVGES